MLLNKYRLKLQMFADDDFDEVEDGDLPDVSDDNMIPDDDDDKSTGDDEEVEDDVEEDNDEEIDDDDDDGDDEEDLDKKTKALIKYKQEAKEAKRKLAEVEEQQRLRELEKEEDKRVDELKKDGLKEDIAKRTAKAETKAKMLEAKLANYEYAELKETYPSIDNHKKEIESLREKLPDMTREEIYLAKFYKNASFEERRKIEAELSYKQRQAKNKSLTTGTQKSKSNVKLTRSEEASYKELKKTFPKMTRERFLENLSSDDEIDF